MGYQIKIFYRILDFRLNDLNQNILDNLTFFARKYIFYSKIWFKSSSKVQIKYDVAFWSNPEQVFFSPYSELKSAYFWPYFKPDVFSSRHLFWKSVWETVYGMFLCIPLLWYHVRFRIFWSDSWLETPLLLDPVWHTIDIATVFSNPRSSTPHFSLHGPVVSIVDTLIREPTRLTWWVK